MYALSDRHRRLLAAVVFLLALIPFALDLVRNPKPYKLFFSENAIDGPARQPVQGRHRIRGRSYTELAL